MTKNQEIGERLVQVRKRTGQDQEVFGAKYGVSRNTQSSYEKGNSSPDAEYLARMLEDGIDVLYILSGRPTDAVGEQPGAYRVALPVELELLEDCIIAGETALADNDIQMSIQERAQLHTLLYEFYSQHLVSNPGDLPMLSADNVVPIIKAMQKKLRR
jgi:transcriptional regulator with XRE-family HTH domain